MKKVPITIASFMILIFSTTGVMAAISGFSDVSEKEWFYSGVKYAQENSLMTGYSANEFGPNDPVSRGQLASILERMEAGNIQKMYIELRAIREYEVNELVGSPWEKYKIAYNRFPLEGIQVNGEGFMTYDSIKDKLKVVAMDNKSTIEVLSTEPITIEKTPFFLKWEGMGGGIFGPFYDNLERITGEIESQNNK